jgi:putative hydrolase of the HAD superfamily
MIKTFIFDLGRVLVPFDHDRGLQILEKHCGFSIDDMRRKIFASEELDLYQSGKISSEEFFAAIKTILSLRMVFEEFVDVWNSSFIFTPIIDDSIIENLAQRFRLLILSDTNELHFNFIRQRFPVLRHFDDFILSYEVGCLKPSEEIFRIAVERAQCLPAECIFTDDLLGNVEGARKIGINAIQFFSADQFQKDVNKIIAVGAAAT